MSNKETVAVIYEAFSRGDVPAILSHLADDVQWEHAPPSTDVPWLQPRRGRGGAAEFFQSLTALQFRQFNVTAILEGESVVVVLCDVEAAVVGTNRSFSEPEEVHLWTFNDAGQVVRFRHRVDTHLQWRAYHGT